MATGAKLVLMRRFEPEAAMALIERELASQIGGVPTIAWQLLEHPARHKYDLSSLELVAYGGAPAASELVRRINIDWPHARAGCGWGMTETSATFTRHLGEDYTTGPILAGRPRRWATSRWWTRRERPAARRGRRALGLRPHVDRRYWNKPEATAATFRDGWLRTGDLARLDEEGFCYIVDRLKDMIIRGGENIYSARSGGRPLQPSRGDGRGPGRHPASHPGRRPGAVVTLRPGQAADEAELKAHVRERLAPFKTPVHVIIRREPLPRNPNGKILKSELKRLFEAPDPEAKPE